ncbi:ADP-ribosylhydrolase ARH3-like isoform X2 [Corticium candelabrum]|uniref:ADP-ribosylhydrolase ARH3-like isoform X2 n=1 Tax=Corticium candelabrum TaxID=121492 RepID=UPI002E262350|nr:ADP-ribosylhydrolase ARH3-like isoform X2 [Corticium candelabrum]
MSLRGRFEGALVGALVGDVLGARFEVLDWSERIPLFKIRDFTRRFGFERRRKHTRTSDTRYTDDTAMTRVLARSLIECRRFNAKRTAEGFCKEYFEEPWRGYGGSVVRIFRVWKDEGIDDPFRLAREQFDGKGSFGNGAAMRIAPVALYGYYDWDMTEMAADGSARLTHSHPDAVSGAVLQCRAVWQALQADQHVAMNTDDFIAELKKVLQHEEAAKLNTLHRVTSTESSIMQSSPYHSQLLKMQVLLARGTPQLGYDVADALGNGVSAKEAVSTAIYAFLHSVKYQLSFHELMDYAISIGGDTDTIASMAGAIAGAYCGVDVIPRQFRDAAESVDDAVAFASSLYDLATSLSSSTCSL